MFLSPDLRRELGALLRLAAPLVGGQLAHTGLSFIDTLMAGRLSPEALGAVAVGNGAWISVQFFVFGVLMVIPPSVAELVGADERHRVGPLMRQVQWIGIAAAVGMMTAAWCFRPVLEAAAVHPDLLPTALAYVRALSWGAPALCLYLGLRFLCEGLGDTKPVLWVGLVALPVNVAGNYVLMYGKLGLPALGAEGCGYATAIVWWAQAMGFLIYVRRREEYRDLDLFRLPDPPDFRELGELLRVGVPIGVAIVMEVALFGAAALMIGSMSAVAVAGHQVALNFASIAFMIPLSLAMGITVRVGGAVGRRNFSAAAYSARTGIVVAGCLQTLAAVAMLTVPETIARLYTRDPEVLEKAVQLLFFAGLFQISDAVQAATAGALRGYKDTRAVMVITAFAYWGVGFPVSYALAFGVGSGPLLGPGMGARGIWLGLIVGLTVSAVALLWRLRRWRPEAAVARQQASAAASPGHR